MGYPPLHYFDNDQVARRQPMGLQPMENNNSHQKPMPCSRNPLNWIIFALEHPPGLRRAATINKSEQRYQQVIWEFKLIPFLWRGRNNISAQRYQRRFGNSNRSQYCDISAPPPFLKRSENNKSAQRYPRVIWEFKSIPIL